MKESYFKGRFWKKEAFTLIELLVVVLIIGILAAVAVPQYQKAVEKSRMAEAVILVRAIANAHQMYYLENGRYLLPSEMNKLDISIIGSTFNSARIKTKDFVYAPNGCGSSCTDPEHLSNYLALATRVSQDNTDLYKISIRQSEPGRLHCGSFEDASAIQEKLCFSLNQKGIL